MTVWPTVRGELSSTWRAIVPRPRLAVSWERPFLLMAAFAYVVVLLLIYLHVQGQTMALQAQTLQLQEALQRSYERQALLTKAVVPPVDAVAQATRDVPGMGVLAPAADDREVPPAFADGRPHNAAKSSAAPYHRAWLQRFHLSLGRDDSLASSR